MTGRVIHVAAVPPLAVVAQLGALPGLVVLAGEWDGGGIVVAWDPVETATDADDITRVFAAASDPQVTRGGPGAGRFTGGWVGWLGYPQPGTPAGWFGRYPNALRYEPATRRWFDVAVTPGDEGVERRRSDAVARLIAAGVAAGVAAASRRPTRGYRIGTLQPDTSRTAYVADVERCMMHIRAGRIYQTNLCMGLESTWTGDPVAMFVDLVGALEPAYAALVCTPGTTVISGSPELFLRRIGREVVSAPIKGTAPRSAGVGPDPAAERLRRSPKERAENVMIVDLMRNDLSRVAAAGSVQVPSLLRVESHCGVWHLVSRVTARLAHHASSAELIGATFPPGSVTGAPKTAARAVIDDLEGSRRGVYTGAVGYLRPGGDLEFNVAIRTLELERDGQLRLGVGAGITVGSTPAAEWAECLAKAAPIAGALGTTVDPGRASGATDLAVPGSVRRAAARRGTARLPSPRRAGGVFTTVLVQRGSPLALADHLDRLQASAEELFGAAVPDNLTPAITAAARRLADAPRARLRIDLNRSPAGSWEWSVGPGSVLGLSPSVWTGLTLPTAQLPGGLGPHKWRDRAAVVAIESRCGGQTLLMDDRHRLLETTRANVLIVRDGRLLTPPLDGRILPGTARRAVLDLAATVGLDVDLRDVATDDLAHADAVGVCNALTGVVWVSRVAGRAWTRPAPALVALHDAVAVAAGIHASGTLRRDQPRPDVVPAFLQGRALRGVN